MNITEQQRVTAYRQTTESTREFYGSDMLTKHVDLLYRKFRVGAPFTDFADIVGDTILGFYKTSQLPELLIDLGITSEDANSITSELKTLLGPLLQSNDVVSLTKKQELAQLAEQFARPRVATPVVEEAVENTAENVTPLRTMQGDMNRIHGYGAYNEALERGEDATQAHVSSQGDILGK